MVVVVGRKYTIVDRWLVGGSSNGLVDEMAW